MKEFATAVKEHQDEILGSEALEFTVDGNQLKGYPPTAAQMAVVLSGIGNHVPLHIKIATIIDFFMEVMEPDSAAYMRSRLLDRNDAFGIDEVSEILHWMFEEWTGRPTPQPSVS